MRRKRRNRSTWFPVLGSESGSNEVLSSVYTTQVEVALNYGVNHQITPLIPDYTWDPSFQTGANDGTLRDYVEGQTCVIERIVGKVYAAAEQIAGSGEGFQTPRVVCACAAVAVLPVDDGGIPLTDADGAEVNPLMAENLDKPWLWRRTWFLGNLLGSDIQPVNYPTSNAGYGSVAEGTHIDTKGVKRAIQRGQRLFMIFATQDVTAGEPNEQIDVQFGVDVRVLGQLRRAKNRSLFT